LGVGLHGEEQGCPSNLRVGIYFHQDIIDFSIEEDA